MDSRTRTLWAPFLGLAAFFAAGSAALSGGLPLAARAGGEREELEALREDLERREAGGRDHFVAQTRQKAVRRLAEIGSEDAWELVLEALEDPSPRVADEAQLALGRVRDEDALSELFGRAGLRSREPLVRLRVAEALGRVAAGMDSEEAERALEKALSDREAEIRRALWWSVERLARGRRLRDAEGELLEAAIRAARKDREPAVRAAALRASSALEGGAARARLAEALVDDHPAVRAAAAGEIARWRGADAVRRLAAVADDPAPLARRTAILGLERVGTREALKVLIERLEPEPRARLRRLLQDTLQRMTGMLFKDDPRPWRVFAERLPSDWRAGRAGPPPKRETRAVSGFAGLPILSDRVAFLVDFSGSIWMERDDGRTRKEVVDEELEKALRSLPETTRFNLIPYSDEPEPWQDELVEARPRNVEKAIEWFRDCRLDGRGNLYDAALLALEDPLVDTLVLLTDGAPTGGHRWNVDLMTDLLVERNRTCGVSFDAVLVGVQGRLRKTWEAFCRKTEGKSVVVDW